MTSGSECPDAIPNGALSDSCTPKYGFACEYTCENGYSKKSDAETITCESTGSWNVNPHTLCTNWNQCSYIIPNGDLDLSCRRLPHEQCRYTCREGFVHSHYATADCRSSGDWMQRLDAFCIPIKCPLYMERGTIQYPCTRAYGEICQSWRCSHPYILPPLLPQLKCNADKYLDHRDQTGFWEKENNMEPCVLEKDLCSSTIPNGDISSDCFLQYGAECSYTCDEGCDKNLTVSKVHCGRYDGQWKEDVYTLCINCRRCPDTINNGRLLTFLCDQRPNTDCDFKCDYGCRMAISRLHCNYKGEWNHPTPCVCSDNSTSSEIQDQGSSTTVIIVVVIILVVFFVILIGIVFLYRFRQRLNRQATAAHERSVVMFPSAPPLDGRLTATHYNRSPYSEVQNASVYADGSRANQQPNDYSVAETYGPTQDVRYSQSHPEPKPVHTYDLASGIHRGQGASYSPGDDAFSPPPSYEEALSSQKT